MRLLRELGTPLAEVDPDADDLRTLTPRHLTDLDARLADLARTRERVRAMEDRLLGGSVPSDEVLLDLLAGMPSDEHAPTRRITLLVYRDLAVAHRYLVDVLGFAPGAVHEQDGRVVHAEVHVGDGVLWMHREAPEHGMLSPLATVTASVAFHVDDVDAHFRRVRDAGAAVVHEPVDQPYGYREYSLHDLEGHLWSFQQPLTETTTEEDSHD